jgi:hypothetical protein
LFSISSTKRLKNEYSNSEGITGDDDKFKDVFKYVFEELGLRNKPSKRSVLSGLQAQVGIYTKELESTITIIHDKIFDILSLYFGKRIPKAILTHGSGTFIAERFLFESVKDDLKIVTPGLLSEAAYIIQRRGNI